MPEIFIPVAASGDDGDWNAATFANNAPTIRAGNFTGQLNNIFARFLNVDINGTINSAGIRLRSSAIQSNTVNLRISAEDAANPTAPGSIADANARVITTAVVDWTPGNWTSGPYFESPDISAIIQELVDSFTYDGTQAINIFVKNNASADNQFRQARSYDHDSVNSPPILRIDYTPANTPPTIAPDTPDATVFPTLNAELEFTGSDVESDGLTYEVQISDSPLFPGDGVTLLDSWSVGTGGIIHPNPLATLAWNGNRQIDDRPQMSFLSTGNSELDNARVRIGTDTDCNGTAVLLVYRAEGVYGTSNAPENPALPEDTPTPGWIAESDPMLLTTPNEAIAWREFTFSGANRIPFEEGEVYMLGVDWRPINATFTNTLLVEVDNTPGAAGNMYIDGDSANNGVFLTADMLFEVYVDVLQIDADSSTDPGFVNTVDGGDTDPFTPDEMIRYTTQIELSPDIVYYWRARCTDVGGSGLPSSWTTTRTFTVTDDDPPVVPTDAYVSRIGIIIGIGI